MGTLAEPQHARQEEQQQRQLQQQQPQRQQQQQQRRQHHQQQPPHHHHHHQQQRQPLPPIAWLPASWTLGLLAAFLAASAVVSAHVPESYMDEPFHVPMAQRYCAGDVRHWDPKVTTFPGLYVIGAAYALAARAALAWAGATLEATCSGPFLRSVNALLAVASIQLGYALSCELQRAAAGAGGAARGAAAGGSGSASSQPQPRVQAASAALALALGLLPTQAFFALLFYTDVPALLFLLLTELLLLRGARLGAAAAGAAAIGMRQTNAVWVAFLTGAAMLQELLQQQQPQQGAAAAAAGPQPGPLRELACLLAAAWRRRGALGARFWPLLALPAGFVCFVAANGGAITLGDKEAHAPSRHLMQPLYLGSFVLLNAAPLLLQPGVAGRAAAALRARPLACGAALAAALAAGCGVAARYSLAHPYLLADNRHYTFYLWRKVIARHWAARYALVPLHVAGWVLLLAGLAATQHWLWVAAFVASCCVTLVPAWLLEFRYFTAPFVLAVLHLPLPPRWASLAAAAGFGAVNAATLWLFCRRPYVWADGSVARFMW